MTATNQERFMLDEAEQAQRRLCEELIAAARAIIAAYDREEAALGGYIDRLEELVGRP